MTHFEAVFRSAHGNGLAGLRRRPQPPRRRAHGDPAGVRPKLVLRAAEAVSPCPQPGGTPMAAIRCFVVPATADCLTDLDSRRCTILRRWKSPREVSREPLPNWWSNGRHFTKNPCCTFGRRRSSAGCLHWSEPACSRSVGDRRRTDARPCSSGLLRRRRMQALRCQTTATLANVPAAP